ncbi:MAG TPA: hypothetical protein DHN29_09375 [Cytophagales bacterium]|nr:hypothetical protein [Cytophagales bacterium]
MDLQDSLIREIKKNLTPASNDLMKVISGSLEGKRDSTFEIGPRFQRIPPKDQANYKIAHHQHHHRSYDRIKDVYEKRSYSSANDTIGIIALFLIAIGIIIAIILGFSWPLREYLNISFWWSILIVLGTLVGLLVVYLGVNFLIKKTLHFLNSRFNSFDVSKAKELCEASKRDETEKDEVYQIIKNTYESLSYARVERERQARNSYNAAIGLISMGILIIFFGVYLLFKNNITSGTLTSGIGGISNIIGGTILKFYKETNNRMDSINNDLFILNTAKVQYALILKIDSKSKRDSELSKLIDSIGKIK